MTACSEGLLALLASASVEVSSHGHQLRELADHFAAGTEVTVTFLPGDNVRTNVETATALRRLGYEPVLDIAATGLLEAHGISRVSVAGHPEGHPFLDEAATFRQLQAWRDWGRESRIKIDIVTQFCFEGAPILKFLGELNARNVDLPVIIGLAGPATPATLTKFALRCGIGNSMRALRGQIGRYGRLLTDAGPDDIMRALEAAPPEATRAVSGFHLFPFGGLRKSRNWLRDYPPAVHHPPQARPSSAQSNP